MNEEKMKFEISIKKEPCDDMISVNSTLGENPEFEFALHLCLASNIFEDIAERDGVSAIEYLNSSIGTLESECLKRVAKDYKNFPDYHRKLWDEVVKKLKDDDFFGFDALRFQENKIMAFKEIFGDAPLINHCFACQAIADSVGLNDGYSCKYCPIEESIGRCDDKSSAFRRGDAEAIRDAVWDWSKIPEEGRRKLGIDEDDL